MENEKLLSMIEKIHIDCFKLCKASLGKYLSIAGNVGIFCQSDKEYEELNKIKEKITFKSNNPKQKYYELMKPIIIESTNNIPKAIYTHLYIRKPQDDSHQRGDVDFVLSDNDYKLLKKKVENGLINNAGIYDRIGWDMIKLSNKNINSLAFIGTKNMCEKVRVRF